MVKLVRVLPLYTAEGERGETGALGFGQGEKLLGRGDGLKPLSRLRGEGEGEEDESGGESAFHGASLAKATP